VGPLELGRFHRRHQNAPVLLGGRRRCLGLCFRKGVHSATGHIRDPHPGSTSSSRVPLRPSAGIGEKLTRPM
jgi:hypothetical protein